MSDFNPQDPNGLDNRESNSIGQEDSFDYTGLILEYFAQWKWVVISVVACLVLAYIYMATIVPIYRVDASVYIAQDDSQASITSSMNPTAAMMNMGNMMMDETQLEILKSRSQVTKVVDSLDLCYSYMYEGKLRGIPVFGNNAVAAKLDSIVLKNLKKPIEITVKPVGDNKYDIVGKTEFEDVKETKKLDNVTLPAKVEFSFGDVELTQVSHIAPLEKTEKITIQSPTAVARGIMANLKAEFADRASTVVRIAYKTNSPAKGADIISALVDFYNRQVMADKNTAAIQTEAFILDRLVMINNELSDVERRLQEYRQQHNIADIAAQLNSSLATKNQTQGEIVDLEAKRQILNSMEQAVAKSGAYDVLPPVTTEPSLNSIVEVYNNKVQQLNRLLENSTSDNPLVKAHIDEVARDKTKVLQSISALKQSLNKQRDKLMSVENRSVGEVASVPSIDKGLQEIFREQQVKVSIYTFLLQKREEIALQKTLATATARLIDEPYSDSPISPNRTLIMMVAFLLGLGIPAIVIFIRQYFFPLFKDQEELARLTRVPIISEISSDGDKDNPIVVGENVSTPIAELFRLLRNNVAFTKNGAEKKVILITSSISGEGKTFIATNLAMTYALTGKKVAVIGMDIRRPVLAGNFGLRNTTGVTTFLSGHTTDVMSLLHQSKDNPNLYIMPSGPVPPNPNELLMSKNMDILIDTLRNNFDYVIIDSAPIGIVSDTYLIVRHSDIQLFVTRASYSTKACIKVLHSAVRTGKLKDPYVVLNGVNMHSRSYTYRRYGRYTSNKTYGYGYNEEGHEHSSSGKGKKK